MKTLTNYIIEKLHPSKFNKDNEERTKVLYKLLDLFLDCDEDSVIFDDEKLRDLYHIANMSISLEIETGYIKLDHITINGHNQGYCTQFMKDLCSWCDLNNRILTLTPVNDFGSHLGRLKKFFKRFGFIENKGSNFNNKIKDTMYRKPNEKSK